MNELRKQLPTGSLWPKNYLNEILFGAKSAICDIEPRLTLEQNAKMIEILGQIIVEVKEGTLELNTK